MAKVATKKKAEVVEQEEVVQEQAKSNVKKLVKKEAPAAKEEPKAKAKKAPKEEDPNQVTLKDLCEEHDLNATTARVKLRRKFGAQGVRYSWEKDSDELAEVVALLTTKAEPKAEKAPAKKKEAPKKKAAKAEAEADEEGEDEGSDEEGEEEEEVEESEIE